MTRTIETDNRTIATIEISLDVEVAEEVIAPGINMQHNETIIDDKVELNVEVVEEVIAPGVNQQHNETLVSN